MSVWLAQVVGAVSRWDGRDMFDARFQAMFIGDLILKAQAGSGPY